MKEEQKVGIEEGRANAINTLNRLCAAVPVPVRVCINECSVICQIMTNITPGNCKHLPDPSTQRATATVFNEDRIHTYIHVCSDSII